MASKKVELGGLEMELKHYAPNSNRDIMFNTIFNGKNDTQWWGLRSRLRGEPPVEWFGLGGEQDYHTCEAAVVRPMLRTDEPSRAIIWLESRGHAFTEGVFIDVARAHLFDSAGKLIATEPGAPPKVVSYYEGQMARFLAQEEVAASLNGAFIELEVKR